ncbi:MAG: M20/M25/M40 family metallo-hydrolase [Hyphomonas sp.]|nr:M20/M25/M40 family metallo-hydrolase [Hyphomonas sp.]
MPHRFLAGVVLIALIAGCATTAAGPQAPLEDGTQTEQAPLSQQHQEFVETILADPNFQLATEMFERERSKTLSTMVELNEIPAPPFQEQVRAEAFAQKLSDLGLADVSIDEVGNVIAHRPGTVGERKIAVVAHMDTVFPPGTDVTVRKEGDTYFAPGISDNTRALAVVLAVVEAMQDLDLQTREDLVFVGSVGEEGLGNLRGVRHLLRGDHGISSFIAVDGGAQDRLITSAVGSNRYRITFKGPGGHSYGAFGRAHPHQALSRAIVEFTERAEPITQSAGAKATFSVGRIGGGTSINSIPFESWMEVDMRSVDPVKLEALDAAFRAALDTALTVENERRGSAEAMTVDIEDVGKRPAGQGQLDSQLVLNATAAMRALGVEPNLQASSTDANIPIWLGVPAITVSRGGRSQNAHSLDESWTDDGSVFGETYLLTLLLAEASYGQ